MDTHLFATVCFGLAILHTFTVKQFRHLAASFPRDSVGKNLFSLLGEVEVVFGLWAAIFVVYLGAMTGFENGIHYVEGLNFTEPIFIFVVMTVCSTRPILSFTSRMIEFLARLMPLNKSVAFYGVTLVVGPLLGSFITEPAAMTVTALILLERFYSRGLSSGLMYATVGLLFVNVSIGGTLTPFAAPPVLMVASTWKWDLAFMLSHFGWKGFLACLISTTSIAAIYFRELKELSVDAANARSEAHVPLWVMLAHLIFLALIVITSHSAVIFFWIFLFFLGLVSVTRGFQQDLKLREGLLVAFFLAGLVVLGPPQRWWLEIVLAKLDALALYGGAIGLTAITDNAALTYLGAQVPTLAEASRYALVAGAVVGGGLTVIANSPNPAGYGILNCSFGEEGISPLRLFLSALWPTVVAGFCFWVL